MAKSKIGNFFKSLKDNDNTQIHDDPDIQDSAICYEDVELNYRRTIEDLEVSLKNICNDQKSMMIRPTSNLQSHVLAPNFNCVDYIKNDIAFEVRIHEISVKLSIVKRRYEYLFGKTFMT